MKPTMPLFQRAAIFFRQILYYPLLLSLYPVLSLYEYNIRLVHHTAIIRTLVLNSLFSFILLAAINRIIQEKHKAALFAALVFISFYVYGSVYRFFSFSVSGHNNLNRLGHVLSLIWIMTIIVSWLILTRLNIPEIVSRFLAVFSLILVLLTLSKSIQFQYTKYKTNKNNLQSFTQANYAPALGYLPDIYYIVLDGHTRSDVLLNTYSYDDSAFTNQLSELGFYIGECSQTNYWHTEFSVSSTLNMDYVQFFTSDTNILPDWKYSKVRQTVASLGYTTIAFESSKPNLNLGEDVTLKNEENSPAFENFYVSNDLNYFEIQAIESSWLRYWLILLVNFSQSVPDGVAVQFYDVGVFENYPHYRNIHFMLEELKEIPRRDAEPKFVFAHIMSPHYPFVFSPDGQYESHSGSDYAIGYPNNVAFIDSQILEIIKTILDRSNNPPIIILQGDHGRHGDDRDAHTAILNAYYLPGGGDQQLYQSISPVNSFRTIFDFYFSTNYALLEDKSYFAPFPQGVIPGSELVPNPCALDNSN